MKYFLTLGLLAFSLAPTTYASASVFECSSGMSDIECQIYLETNRVRAENRRSKLLISQECTDASVYHAIQMDKTGVYAHNIEGDLNFGERMEHFNVPGARMAENLHNRRMYRFSSNEQAAKEIVQDWYDSTGHRKNLLNRNFKSIGIAVIGDFQVQCFTDYADSEQLQLAEEQEQSERRTLRDLFDEIRIPNPFKR